MSTVTEALYNFKSTEQFVCGDLKVKAGQTGINETAELCRQVTIFMGLRRRTLFV